MPSHPLNDRITHAVSLLRERGVFEEHDPLRPLLVAKDAYGQEAGLTVPEYHSLVRLCPVGHTNEVWRCLVCKGEWASQTETLGVCRHVARTLDGWPESAIVGWVKGLCVSVGWHLSTDLGNRWAAVMYDQNRVAIEGTVIIADTEAAAALSALIRAIEETGKE